MGKASGRWLSVFSIAALLFATNPVIAQDSSARNGSLPDSPGFLVAQNGATQPSNQSGLTSAPGTQPSQTPSPSPSSQTRESVGTAAAESLAVTGVAASAPAGAAIAPAKQKRVRVILISIAAVAGAGIALGTVAALSAGSPSRPPGASH